MLKKILFWPYQLYAVFVFLPLAAVITFVCGWLAVFVAWLVNPRFSSRYVASPWARILAWLTPISVEVQGAENADRSRTYVVVANHVSQYDILALYGWLDLDLKWVIKKELRKIPAVGIGCEMVGHIFVDRKNPVEARRAVNEALNRLGDGVGILFFPEGTRSRDGKLMHFKKGAFKIALMEELPVLPVTLLGTERIMPAKTLRLFPGRVKVVIHPAIEPLEDNTENLKALMKQARDTIASALPEERRG